jgi:hypothetical protein
MNDRRRKDSKTWYIGTGLVLAVAVIGGWIGYVNFYKPDPGPNFLKNDPICIYVSDKLQLRCVVGLAAEGVLGPGHFVSYPSAADAHTKVPFPDGDLFSDTCLVPGEQADALQSALKKQEQLNTVSVDQFSYQVDRRFRAGAELPIPRLANLVVKAGPQLSEVKQIDMKVSTAWLKTIDVNQFLDLLDNSGIRKRCIDNLLSANYRVVSKALIAKDIAFTITEKEGRSLDLSAAASAGKVTVIGGANASNNTNQTIANAATTAVVLGVDFLGADLFRNRPKLSQPVVYAPSGQATISATGNGGEGAFGQVTQTASLERPATLSALGGESSECEGGKERTKSSANIQGAITSPDAQTVRFEAIGEIGGGHYATGRCSPFGGLIIGAGHDTGASAVYSFNGFIRTTVRSDDSRSLTIRYDGLPNDTHVEVRDPRGELLKLRDGGVIPTIQGSGSLEFALRGAGVYVAQITATYNKSVNGASRLGIRDSATLSASVQ